MLLRSTEGTDPGPWAGGGPATALPEAPQGPASRSLWRSACEGWGPRGRLLGGERGQERHLPCVLAKRGKMDHVQNMAALILLASIVCPRTGHTLSLSV